MSDSTAAMSKEEYHDEKAKGALEALQSVLDTPTKA